MDIRVLNTEDQTVAVTATAIGYAENANMIIHVDHCYSPGFTLEEIIADTAIECQEQFHKEYGEERCQMTFLRVVDYDKWEIIEEEGA